MFHFFSRSVQALVEILLLSGGTPYANFRHLAHAWGRERGFHHVLVNTVCERRGEVERKRRSDARDTTGASKRGRQDDDRNQKPVENIYLHPSGMVTEGNAYNDIDGVGSSTERKRPAEL